MSGEEKRLSSHDQNFKNLTVDYPLASIEFYAHAVFPRIEGNPTVRLLRQEQQKEQLSKHHRELDIPILLEWPDGDKALVIFAIEAESNPYKFDAARLAQYCLDLSRQHNTERVVPVVVFTKKGKFQEQLQLGTEDIGILHFQFIACQLPLLNYQDWHNSDNIVARLTLPLMRYPQQEKLAVVNKSLQGLLTLEPNTAKQGKYIEFIEHYSQLDEEDIIEFKQRYPEEGNVMGGYYKRLVEESAKQSLQQGLEQGERLLLLKLLKRRFTKQAAQAYENKLLQASSKDIERWAENILDAETIEEVFA